MLGSMPVEVGILLECGEGFFPVLREFVPISAKGGGSDDEDADVWVNVRAWVGEEVESKGEGALAGFLGHDAVNDVGL